MKAVRVTQKSEPGAYRWRQLFAMVTAHRRELVLANIIAVLATLSPCRCLC